MSKYRWPPTPPFRLAAPPAGLRKRPAKTISWPASLCRRAPVTAFHPGRWQQPAGLRRGVPWSRPAHCLTRHCVDPGGGRPILCLRGCRRRLGWPCRLRCEGERRRGRVPLRYPRNGGRHPGAERGRLRARSLANHRNGTGVRPENHAIHRLTRHRLRIFLSPQHLQQHPAGTLHRQPSRLRPAPRMRPPASSTPTWLATSPRSNGAPPTAGRSARRGALHPGAEGHAAGPWRRRLPQCRQLLQEPDRPGNGTRFTVSGTWGRKEKHSRLSSPARAK